ncbi:protein transport protein sec31 [Triticum aestivum]|nr:protein transport protein sec31-like [Triticum aestivum]
MGPSGAIPPSPSSHAPTSSQTHPTSSQTHPTSRRLLKKTSRRPAVPPPPTSPATSRGPAPTSLASSRAPASHLPGDQLQPRPHLSPLAPTGDSPHPLPTYRRNNVPPPAAASTASHQSPWLPTTAEATAPSLILGVAGPPPLPSKRRRPLPADSTHRHPIPCFHALLSICFHRVGGSLPASTSIRRLRTPHTTALPYRLQLAVCKFVSPSSPASSSLVSFSLTLAMACSKPAETESFDTSSLHSVARRAARQLLRVHPDKMLWCTI